MIDIHNHILYGLDDGPQTMEESIYMCRVSYKDGVRTIVATPHTLNGLHHNDRETILSKVHELNDAIKQFGVRSLESRANQSTALPFELSPLSSDLKLAPVTQLLNHPMTEFKILPGADVHFSEEILLQLDRGEVTTVGDGKKFIIIEFPFHAIPFRTEEVLFQLMARGIVPIISHPERNLEILRNPARYYEMIRMGCLGQVTAMSLTGGFGSKVREFVEKLFKKRLIHLIASDAHNINGRSPVLTPALGEAEKIVGKEEARKMVTEYPEAIIEGKRPHVPEPLSL